MPPAPTSTKARRSRGSGAPIATCSATVTPALFHKALRASELSRVAESQPISFARSCRIRTGAMPDLALTRAEIDDVIGYIGTLR